MHPLALAVLQKGNFPTGELRAKNWEEFSRPEAPQLDFVFTVCDNAANETCLVSPGQTMTVH